MKNIVSGGCRIGKGIFRGKVGGLERIGKSLKSLVNKRRKIVGRDSLGG